MKQTPGTNDDKVKKNINPESMILPDPEIIAFLAETRGVAESDILENLEPSIYAEDLTKVHQCITEVFGIDYTVPDTILPHVAKLIDGDEGAKNSIKLYFSDKDEFREKLDYGNLDKRKMIEIGDTIAKKFEAFVEALIANIPRRETNK